MRSWVVSVAELMDPLEEETMARPFPAPGRFARDELVDAVITLKDGTTEALVILKRPAASGGCMLFGYSQPLVLPPGATLMVHE